MQTINMLKLSLSLTLGLQIATISQAETDATFTANESTLLELARKSPPTQLNIELSQTVKALNLELEEAKFGSQVTGAANYSSSRESPISPFAPIFSPAQDLSVGYQRLMPKGLALSSAIFAEKISFDGPTGPIDDATRIGWRVGAEIDLWKNLWGRLDKLSYEGKEIDLEVSKLRGVMAKKDFEMSLLKVYWSLIANKESRELTQNLVKSAKRQLNQTRARARDGASDAGDVARSRALVKSRESSLLFFDYQRELLETQLKTLLPELSTQDIILAGESFTKKEEEMVQCMAKIVTGTAEPQSQSSYFDLIALLEKAEANANAQAEWTDSMDIKLKGQLQNSNADQGYGNTLSGYSEDNQFGNAIGIEISMPLNPSLSAAKKTQKRIANLQKKAEVDALKARLMADFDKTKTSLQLLGKALETQTGAANDLEISLKTTTRKYQQARVDLNSLILEQDSYFNSRLVEIDTKQQTIHLMYDFFKSYNRYPCGINQI
ncbi:MAG: TolC family protein [Pseudobacteriovorax sp.]|nr:TolC family protein [Pseudobacteriovorax sp.]